jgi:hypothetical protein
MKTYEELKDENMVLDNTVLYYRAYLEHHNLIDESGYLRKIKGNVPVTADGVVVFDGAKVWPREDFWVYRDEANENWTPEDEAGIIRTSIIESSGEHIPPSEVDVSLLYSSPEAAKYPIEKN